MTSPLTRTMDDDLGALIASASRRSALFDIACRAAKRHDNETFKRAMDLFDRAAPPSTVEQIL